MKMMDQEVASLAALQVASNIIYDNTALHMSNVLESDEVLAAVPKSENKAALSGQGKSPTGGTVRRHGKLPPPVPRTARKTKEGTEITTCASSIIARKHDKKGVPVVDTSDDKMNVSEVVTEHIHLHSGNGVRKYPKDTNRKLGKMQQSDVSASDLLTTAVRTTARPTRKMVKSSLRRFKRNLGQKPIDLEGRISAEMSTTELIGNKAENNNWMLDAEESSDTQGGFVVPTLHTKSCAPNFDSFIQPNSDCKPALKTVPGDNSPDVLSLPKQSSNVRGDGNLERHSPDGRLVARSVESTDPKRVSCNAGVCAACGSDIHTPKYSLCKHCGTQNRVDDNRNGPLDELKSYAQSFANSVKKIMLISPVLELSSEIVHCSGPEGHSEESAKTAVQEETVSRKFVPELCLNRYRTEINMGGHSETRSKSLLSKSMSYDGRVGTSMKEKGSRSPIHWINRDKVKGSDSFSKVSDPRVSRVEEDGFVAGREEKQFLAYEGDKNTINKADKLKTKISIKQLARVERARTDGDLRTNNAPPAIPSKKQVKDESKKGYEFQRNRSKTFHELETGPEEQDSCSPQREAETDISISRLKVIHEGSPVDPPNTADGKKGDDGKGRKAIFIRSATAPNRNHLPRKEIPTGIAMLDSAERTSRSNTKITVRTNKASTLRKENSLGDRRKVQDILEAYTNDVPLINSMSFTKRRSTSYDSSQVGPKRDELHRSSSWSVIDVDDEESKHRREPSPSGYVSAKRRNEQTGFSVSGELSSWLRGSAQKTYHSSDYMSVDPFLYSELSVGACRQTRHEAYSADLPVDSAQDRSLWGSEEQLQREQPQTEDDASEAERRYYDDEVEKRLPSCIEEEESSLDQYDGQLDNESYYTENPKTINLVVDDVIEVDPDNDNSDLKSVTEDEGVYHDEINKHASPGISDSKNSPWYSPLQVLSSDSRSLVRRDRSLESKSTTSFHIVTMARSSHSDEAITRYGGALEHALSRRQSVYTETDVDTGLIYHLAKRQTTRAHVPPYHDLTNASREIYTMSGDVSTSTSSNSANSNRSELSECVYTGGFYKDDPFYDNDSKGSRSSSSEKSSNIYYESTGISKRETSEIDIYTGSIFNSNQNTMTSSHIAEMESTAHESDVKDNRIRTSARSGAGRTQRSVRCRPRVDAIMFRNNDSAWEYFSQPVVICGENKSYNVSNNSNNWYGMDNFDNSCPNCTIITKSADPLYTDYDPGMRPEFHVRRIEKSGSVFDFLKYDSAEEANKTFFSPPRRDDSCNDGIWYSGLLHDPTVESTEAQASTSHHTFEGSPYSWQYYDDYYTSTVRPIVNKTNNCTSCNRGSFPCDTNNNHFDDIYTGSYGAQNASPSPQEQPQPTRPPVVENWYMKQPTPTYTSATLYDQSYESCYTVPGPARRSASDTYEPMRDPYSTYASPKEFGQEPPASSDSSVYMVDDGWWKYGPKVSSPLDEPQPRRPEKTASGEPESYFRYASKASPERNFYVIDDDTYSFEPRVESEAPEIPAVKEIKTVGGIVCRENVANKDDYAEDINRDLEPGAWVPFTFRRDEDAKYPQETAGGHDKQESQRTSEAVGTGQSQKHIDDTYANNRLYDNFGARKNWQRPQGKQENTAARSRDSSHHRAFQAGDTGKQDQAKSFHRNSTDIVPDKARGKRNAPHASKTTAAENSSSPNKGSGSSTASKNKRR